ncbi:MAG TPA: UDP-glucose 4-epimerase GalE, partial [Sediminispirochaeta sp.]|nr:UDP-glucose 4-epimerase GalE [Sediminispirochaeta sp.]
ILDQQRLDEVCGQGWDGLVHLAAFKAAGESMLEPEKYAVNNISGSINIISSCTQRGITNLVLSSSAAVYGEPEYLPVDEAHPTEPTNYYGFTKLEIERNLQWFHRLRGLNFAALRYFNAAGYDLQGRVSGLENNPANLIPVVMEAAVGRREALSIFGDDYPTPDGTGVRDYIHVNDLAEAHVSAMEFLQHEKRPLIVNLGSETGLSVLEVLEAARRISGRSIPAKVSPRRPGDPAKLLASSRKARELLGWQAKHSGVDQLIESTWKVYWELA